MFRVFYGRVFSSESEARKAEKLVHEFSPIIVPGRASYFVELGRYKTMEQADTAYMMFRGRGLRVFIQNLGE